MVPIRLAAFATMFHQGWTSRADKTAPAPVPAYRALAEVD
jgi:hypothetical protein